jgi:hypothetical protein
MRRDQVIRLIGKARLEEFDKWMAGQTVGMYADGTCDYYDEDVERFIEGKDVID